MQKTWLTRSLALSFFLFLMTSWTNSIAQEAEYTLAHEDVFGKLRRPPVEFSHDLHSESLESEGCMVCHHVPDEKSGRLVYVEGEEFSCKECHEQRQKDQSPALREAYHGNCTVCHRRLIKAGRTQSGPTTCGGCHVKQ